MNRPLTVAVVGTGFPARTRLTCWGKVHHANVETVSVSRDQDNAAAFARENGASFDGEPAVRYFEYDWSLNKS